MDDTLFNLIVECKQTIDDGPAVQVDGRALIEALYWIQNGDWDDMSRGERGRRVFELTARIFS